MGHDNSRGSCFVGEKNLRDMLIKIISLHFSATLGGFDDTTLQEFLRDKEILSIRDHFFVQNQVPCLTMVIHYLSHQEIDFKVIPQKKREGSWRESLREPDLGFFNLLRAWRSDRCKKEEVPPYVLFTNQQLVGADSFIPLGEKELFLINTVRDPH